MKRKLSKDYTVTGNGVAYRKASSYLKDPRVIETLKQLSEKKNANNQDS